MTDELVLGSRNAHKLREFRQLLAPVSVVPLPESVELPPETGETFAENAATKARAAARGTGAPALGEDSGIVVPALSGAPGIRSARYAGPDATDEENLAKLLAEAEALTDRTAAYVCALVFAAPGDEETLFEGRCGGTLAHRPAGSGGFGYDPIFVPDEGPDSLTMAQLPPERKNAISHRGRAAHALLEWLASREKEGVR
jgi:XTP/dITP diphosphohydrolase